MSSKLEATYGPGRTTPPLEARIAGVLAEHDERKTLDDYCYGCSCGWKAGLADAHEEHVAAALLPVIAEAQADAWDACTHATERQFGKNGSASPQLLRRDNPYRRTP